MSTATVFIDGIDVTNVSVEGSATHRLNGIGQAQVKIPMDAAIGGTGSLLKVYVDGNLFHHGRVLLCESEADEQTGYTVYNSSDPLELWSKRLVRQNTLDDGGQYGNISYPTVVEDFGGPPGIGGPPYGPCQIIEQIVNGSEGDTRLGNGTPPDDADGPLYLAQGGFATNGTDMTGAPTDYPMRMSDLASLLCSTGELDIIITPIELDGDGNYGQIDCYNGDFGNDFSSSVIFEYGQGSYNIRRLRWNSDMSNMANKLVYFLGQRLNPGHWPSSIDGTDPSNPWWASCLDKNGNPFGDTLTGVTDCTGSWDDPYTSQGQYGVRMDLQIFDARGDESTAGQCVYRMRWLEEAWLRCQPMELLHLTPTRDTAIGTFDIGDIVGVDINSAVNGGLSNFAQRVYEYTISWDEDSVLEIGELVTSSQNDGFGL